MISMQIRGDVSALLAQHSELRNELLRAAARAVNATAVNVRTEAVKEIAKRVGGVPAATVRGYVTVKKAKYSPPRLNKAGQLRSNYAGIAATVTAAGKAPNLIYFVNKASQTPEAFRNDPGVTANVMGRQTLYNDAFIVRVRGGKPVVVSRVAKTPAQAKAMRVKIAPGVWKWKPKWSKGKYGPPMKALAASASTHAAMDAVARARWPLHWQREVAKVKAKAAGGVA